MRIALVVSLLLAGCTQNLAELDSAQVILDRQLVEAQVRGDRLSALRGEVDELEAQVSALATTPDSQAMLTAARAKAHPTAKRAPFIPPTLPPVGAWEGEAGARRRRMIADTQARISMLEKVLQEVDRLEAERDALKADLALLKSLNGQAPAR